MPARYSYLHEKRIIRPDIDKFLNDLSKFCEEQGFCLGIDKGSGPYGNFIVTDCTSDAIEWLQAAHIGRSAAQVPYENHKNKKTANRKGS